MTTSRRPGSVRIRPGTIHSKSPANGGEDVRAREHDVADLSPGVDPRHGEIRHPADPGRRRPPDDAAAGRRG